MSKKGCYFAVDSGQWKRAVSLGMNASCAYLVLAAFSDRTNTKTSASVHAIESYTALSRPKAQAAIRVLLDAQLLEQKKAGKHPAYAIPVSQSPSWTWLPIELVTGAAGETSPVERVRQTQDAQCLRLLVDLYRDQTLWDEGGIPRKLLHQDYTRTLILERAGYNVWGFDSGNLAGKWDGALASHRNDGNDALWRRVDALRALGLVEFVPTLFDGSGPDACPMYPLGGTDDDGLGRGVGLAALASAETLLGEAAPKAEQYSRVAAIPKHIASVELIGIARLRYRPRTAATGQWWAEHAQACHRAIAFHEAISKGNFLAVPG